MLGSLPIFSTPGFYIHPTSFTKFSLNNHLNSYSSLFYASKLFQQLCHILVCVFHHIISGFQLSTLTDKIYYILPLYYYSTKITCSSFATSSINCGLNRKVFAALVAGDYIVSLSCRI